MLVYKVQALLRQCVDFRYKVQACTLSGHEFRVQSNGIYSVRTRISCTKYRHLLRQGVDFMYEVMAFTPSERGFRVRSTGICTKFRPHVVDSRAKMCRFAGRRVSSANLTTCRRRLAMINLHVRITGTPS